MTNKSRTYMNYRLADVSRVVFRVKKTERYWSSQEKEFLNKIQVKLFRPWTRQKSYSLFKDRQGSEDSRPG